MIRIFAQENQLFLLYEAGELQSVNWIDNKLKREGRVTFRRTFTFKPDDLWSRNDSEAEFDEARTFLLGVESGDYFKINSDILGLKHDLLISKQMPLNVKTFIAYRDISIISKIDSLIDEPIILGGDAKGSIPQRDFEELVKNFPNSTELTHYASSRISRTLKDYLGTMSDGQRKLEKFLRKKKTIKGNSSIDFIKIYEIQKFEYLRDELREMLADAESFAEKDWQKQIVGILLLIFPKYVAILEDLHIKDYYSDPGKVKNRFIDLTLVDANGMIDIVEIKKPFANCILSTNKYRDNYTPKMELSGSVMQVEKYVFHLNKWGREGERTILEKRKDEFPPDFEIKVTNPKAIIILGRDSDFRNDQKFDFEIIKRKYANIIDIMTYDDLLRRLNNIILMISNNYS